MIGSEFYPLSVSKAYYNRSKGIKHRPNTKKYWFVYGIEYDEFEEETRFRTFRVNPLQALWYKTHLAKKQNYICNECDEEQQFYVRGREKPKECQYCDSIDLSRY